MPETLDLGPELAVGLGYGESKWVTEQILRQARRETGLRTTSVRVGQLSGDSRVGGWNVKEWVPVLVRASQRLGCVPEKDDVSSSLFVNRQPFCHTYAYRLTSDTGRVMGPRRCGRDDALGDAPFG